MRVQWCLWSGFHLSLIHCFIGFPKLELTCAETTRRLKTLPGKATANLMPLFVTSYTIKNGVLSSGVLLEEVSNDYVPSNASKTEVPVGTYRFRYTAVGENGQKESCLTLWIYVSGDYDFLFSIQYYPRGTIVISYPWSFTISLVLTSLYISDATFPPDFLDTTHCL